jgi:hypothetical protein
MRTTPKKKKRRRRRRRSLRSRGAWEAEAVEKGE